MLHKYFEKTLKVIPVGIFCCVTVRILSIILYESNKNINFGICYLRDNLQLVFTI